MRAKCLRMLRNKHEISVVEGACGRAEIRKSSFALRALCKNE